MKNKKTIGIYSITCLPINKVYVGQSRAIANRKWQHFNDLKKQKHCNSHLQNAFNKYGEENFIFTVLENCELEELCIKEAHWIGVFKSNIARYGFNQKEVGELVSCSESYRVACGATTIKRNVDKHGLYTLFNLQTGEVVQTEIRKPYTGDKTHNYKKHYLCLREWTLQDFKEHYERYNAYQKLNNSTVTRLYAKNLTTGEVLEFPSVCRGARELGIKEELVRNVVKGRKLSTNNYTFSRTTEFPEQVDRSCISVFVLDKEGCRYYDSQYKAASLEFPSDKHASSYIKDFIDTERTHKGCKFFSVPPTEIDKTILQYNLTAQEASAYRIVYENKTIAPKDLPATNKSNRARLKNQLIEKNLITQCPTTFNISLTN